MTAFAWLKAFQKSPFLRSIPAWLTKLLRRSSSPAGNVDAPAIPIVHKEADQPDVVPVVLAVEEQISLPSLKSQKTGRISLYEKRRRKHDQFVTPQGERQERKQKKRSDRQEIKPATRRPEIVPPENELENHADGIYDDFTLVDRHHVDGEDVLYKVEEMQGEFNFRDTILQQLDRYFFYLKRMKQGDRDAYDLYKQIGATLLPYIATGSWNRGRPKEHEPRELPPLPPVFNRVRPAFGCFVYGADPETEKYEQISTDEKKREMWVPKFMYFTKYKMPPSTIQPMGGGDIYSLTVWWDRPDKKKCKHGIPQSIPFYVSADGKTVCALKILETKEVRVGGYVRRHAGMKPKQRHRQPPVITVPQKAWRFPSEYIDWAKFNHETVEHFLACLFVDSIRQAELSRMSMTRVAATKDRMTAVFSVNINRTSYFFQDRDISVTSGGTRKPIFHVVKPHVRKDGTAIKMHFRGARDFTWAGYQIRISIPGLDHNDISEMSVGVVDEEWVNDSKGWIDSKKVGAMLAEHMRKELA